MANVSEEAKAALERLKTLLVPGTGGVEAPELIRLADLAASLRSRMRRRAKSLRKH